MSETSSMLLRGALFALAAATTVVVLSRDESRIESWSRAGWARRDRTLQGSWEPLVISQSFNARRV